MEEDLFQSPIRVCELFRNTTDVAASSDKQDGTHQSFFEMGFGGSLVDTTRWDIDLSRINRPETRAITSIIEEMHRQRQPRDPSDLVEMFNYIQETICNVPIATKTPGVTYTIGSIVTAKVVFQKTIRKNQRTEQLQAEGEEDVIPLPSSVAARKPRRPYRRKTPEERAELELKKQAARLARNKSRAERKRGRTPKASEDSKTDT